MKILALDTATEACSAALYVDGSISEKYQEAPRRHAELILPMLDELMRDAKIHLVDLDAIAFGCGPGAFTGVRIASSVVQGLAYAAALPVIPVSTLAAMAEGANQKTGNIISAIDARMSEIYVGVYQHTDGDGIHALLDEQVCKPEAFDFTSSEPCFGIGSGWASYGMELSNKFKLTLQGVKADYFPRASDILNIAIGKYKRGEYLDAAQAVPIYLRDNVVANKKK